MIGQIVLAVVSVPSIGFMLYVLLSVQRAIRREQQGRLRATVLINRQQNSAPNFTLIDGVAHQKNVFDEYKTPAIRPLQDEFAGIGFDLQPLRKTSPESSR
jgi:hypothetical protein